MISLRSLSARVVMDPFNPVQHRDLTLDLIALLRLRDYGTPAARRRAYARIPHGPWGRARQRELARLIEDIKRPWR